MNLFRFVRTVLVELRIVILALSVCIPCDLALRDLSLLVASQLLR